MRRRTVRVTLGVVCLGVAILLAIMGSWWVAAGFATVGTGALMFTPMQR
jgi:hypothetical protein